MDIRKEVDLLNEMIIDRMGPDFLQDIYHSSYLRGMLDRAMTDEPHGEFFRMVAFEPVAFGVKQ